MCMGVSRASLVGNTHVARALGRCTCGSFCFVSRLAEERSASDVGHSMSNFEVTMGTGPLCVSNVLWNVLAINVCNEINVVKVY